MPSQATSNPARRLISGQEADERSGLSKSTRYREEAAGRFPCRVLLTPNGRIGYYEDEIQEWIASRPRAGEAPVGGDNREGRARAGEAPDEGQS